MIDTNEAAPSLEILERGCAVLVALVRDEYPEGWTLAQIAQQGLPQGATEEQMQALEAVEAWLGLVLQM